MRVILPYSLLITGKHIGLKRRAERGQVDHATAHAQMQGQPPNRGCEATIS